MPTYGYRCGTCDHEFEVVQRMTDEPLTVCPKCQGKLSKKLYPTGVIFKGSGFYTTDYKASSSSAGAENNGSAAASSEGKSDVKSEGKAEGKSTVESEGKSNADDSGSSKSSESQGKSKSDSKTEKAS